jgi:hypothetical protein
MVAVMVVRVVVMERVVVMVMVVVMVERVLVMVKIVMVVVMVVVMGMVPHPRRRLGEIMMGLRAGLGPR